ncbi:MAG: hypothetical protein IKO65_01830, partial [Victivallales bacterium]|nr:hypothetical protein [Victivallales bacterium]
MKATHTVIKTIRAESLEHERYCQLLQLCREGTPRELLACIQNSHNGKSILNTIYWIQDFLDDYLETTPLANACIGGNEENVRLLLIHGAIPDIEDRVDGLFVKPACIFAIGKPNLLKLFFPAAPWWKGECSDGGCQSLNQLDGDGGTLVPHPDPNYIIWCVMRGARVESPKRLYKACFRSLPPLMQEFVIRCGVRKEKLENFRKWLTMRKATPELLEILR